MARHARRILFSVITTAATAVGLASCGSESAAPTAAPAAPSTKPALRGDNGWPIRTGVDECAQCTMLVQKPGFGAVLIVERAGARERLVFDDLGCYLDYRHEHRADSAVVGARAHVAGYDSDAALPSADAVFVAADPQRLGTPMNSGLVAVSTREAAERLAKEVGGEVLDEAGAAAWRRAFMERRYGKPKEPPPNG